MDPDPNMTDDDLEIMEEFVQESREHLAVIEPDLLAMERQGSTVSAEVVNRVFRAIHSTKGGAAFLGFEALKHFSHTMESVLGLVRDGKLEITPQIADVLLRGVDVLKRMVEDLRVSDQVPHHDELVELEAILSGEPGVESAGRQPPPPVAIERPKAADHGAEQGEPTRAPVQATPASRGSAPQPTGADEAEALRQKARAHGMRAYRIDAQLDEDLESLGLSVERVLQLAAGVGVLVSSAMNGERDKSATRLVMELWSVLEPTLLATALGLSPRCLSLVEPGARRSDDAAPQAVLPSPHLSLNAPEARPMTPGTAAAAPAPRPESSPGGQTSEATETLRVRVDLLNRLMNSASELVLGRNQLLRTLKDSSEHSTGLGIILQHIDRVTTELQEGIMQTRMQPVGTLFGRFSRVARDLGRQLGKQVELRTEGNHVELDKSIIEALVDPLTHIVRNSVDHAIEMPDERRQRGKPESGRILLTACHESGQVNIVVSDDGRGIDRGRVLHKAIERGLISPAAADAATERDVMNLLMAPGFSTAERISDVSGRGVGMDVVRTNVESLGGQIEIDSEWGQGTTVRLRLPLTLAIIPSLIVGSGKGRFAVPQASIVELVWVRANEANKKIQMVHGVRMLRLRGHLVPLVSLKKVLEIEPMKAGAEADNSDFYVLLLKTGVDRYGLIVDELFESEEIVVKPLPQFLKNVECFVGTTILGDGSVTMILDPNGVAVRGQLTFASHAGGDEHGTNRADQGQSRSVILFAAAPGEQFAVPQERVLRLERIQRSDLRTSGGREYITYRGSGLRVVRVDQHLPVGSVPEEATELFLLIPRHAGAKKGEDSPGGILVWRILDALDVTAEIKPPIFIGPGVLGTALIDGTLTTFLEPLALLTAEGLTREHAA